MVTKMAEAQKMENEEKRKRKDRKGKREKGNTRSAGLVKFRGTAGPYKVGKRV